MEVLDSGDTPSMALSSENNHYEDDSDERMLKRCQRIKESDGGNSSSTSA